MNLFVFDENVPVILYKHVLFYFSSIKWESGVSCSPQVIVEAFDKPKNILFLKVAPEILQAPFNTTVIESNNASLLCQATGNPQPNITWIKVRDNQTLSTSETLHLENLTREDDGAEYKCIAVNSIGSAEVSAVITVHCKYSE